MTAVQNISAVIMFAVCGQLYRPVRGAKSVGTRETGSKKVNWPAGEKDKHEKQQIYFSI